MRKQWVGLVLGVAALIIGASAQASLITYDLRGHGGNLGNSEWFSSDGVSMRAVAVREYGSSWYRSADLYQTRRGLGVRSGGSDSSQIDGYGRDEGIVFAFNRSMTLTDAWFGSLGSSDDWNLSVYDGGSWHDVLDDERRLNGDFSGSAFQFWADHHDDDFYISGLRFHAAVPEPGTLLLMGLGLAAVGLSRRASK